jgi:NAD(P)-dependent dehydrogenase (short-subunit alcohol dehydrogenase family)
MACFRLYASNVGQQLDILVNNVGTNVRKATVDYSEEEVSHLLNTNMLSFFDLTKYDDGKGMGVCLRLPRVCSSQALHTPQGGSTAL